MNYPTLFFSFRVRVFESKVVKGTGIGQAIAKLNSHVV